MKMKGRVAIVTGAARGMGRTHCLALAAQGAHVVHFPPDDLFRQPELPLTLSIARVSTDRTVSRFPASMGCSAGMRAPGSATGASLSATCVTLLSGLRVVSC